MSFAAEIERLTLEYEKRTKGVIRDSCREISTRIVLRTPVDTGNARRNWEASGIDEQVYTFLNALTKTPYIRRLEYGWSKQAPQGMVRISVAEWPDIVRKSVEDNA